MKPAVYVSGLEKDYAGEHALAGVSFEVSPGCLFGLIGADGAGKTTLLRILTTLSTFDQGSVEVLGKNVNVDFRYLRNKTGYMPQKFSLYQDLSVKENIVFFADVFGVKSGKLKERMEQLLSFSRLTQFANRRSRDLSGGMKQKLALSCALIHTPKIIFLDEPTTGVDPVSRREFWDILSDLKKKGITIVVSTPYMDEAQKCDELLFLHHGKIMRKGKPDDLLDAYPYNLFSVKSETNRTISYPQTGIIPKNLELIYPSEGSLHIAVRDNFLSKETVLSCVNTVLPEASIIKKITPKIEDLFIYLLSDTK
jgi:ABC-2 type transport system ATP-binding protein